MTTFQDCSIGLAVESTYRTFVTPTRFLEFTEESLNWEKNIRQGAGLRVGGRVARAGRRVIPSAQGGGDFTVDLPTKGMGLLWQAAMGTASSTLVSGSLYQQVFTLGDTPNSLTIQKGTPRVNGTVDATSLLGCMVTEFEIDAPSEDIVTARFAIDAGDSSFVPAYATPSYSNPALFHFANGVVAVNGTLTAPTTTALASVTGPAAASIRSFNVQVNHNYATDRFNFGGAGRKDKPAVGLREITGRVTVEYDSTTLRDAFLADSAISLLATFTNGTDVFQVVLPDVRLDGDLPESNGGELITVDHDFTVLDNLVSAQPIWLVARTADTAL